MMYLERVDTLIKFIAYKGKAVNAKYGRMNLLLNCDLACESGFLCFSRPSYK